MCQCPGFETVRHKNTKQMILYTPAFPGGLQDVEALLKTSCPIGPPVAAALLPVFPGRVAYISMLYLNVSFFFHVEKHLLDIFFLRRFKMKKDGLMSFCLLSKYLGTRFCAFLLTSHWACPLSTLIQENLKLSLVVAAAWRDVAQLKGEGAAFVESKVCPFIF